MTFTDAEKSILNKYVTDTEGDVYAIQNLPGIVGAVYARYSRAKTGFRETLLREFIEEGNIDVAHADKLIERVLIAYGDDSVGELEGAHVAFENISVLATKEIEDRRIGGSPIEKSTRYVFFDEKDADGKYRYVREPRIMASIYAKKYEETMDFVFDTYSALVKPMQDFYAERFPVEDAEYDILGTGQKQKLADLADEKNQKAFQITYKTDQRTKACDALRCLLPLATKTNVGMFGNGRYFQGLISHLLSTPYQEAQEIGKKTFRELSKTIPQYVHRAAPKEYTIINDQNMRRLAGELCGEIAPAPAKTMTLMPPELRNTREFLLAHMLYTYLELPLTQIFEIVKGLDAETKLRIQKTYVGERKTRRDRPGRAFESGYTYTFDLCADFGTYKDLMRHRLTTQLRQPFSPRHGMIIPQDITDAGFADKVAACHDRTLELYNELFAVVDNAASYVTLHGHRVRWIMGMNDREAMHLLELRTGKQGHPQYRKLCQQMHRAIEYTDAWRANIMNFVDHNDYTSARGDSEAKQRVKEKEFEEKYGDK